MSIVVSTSAPRSTTRQISSGVGAVVFGKGIVRVCRGCAVGELRLPSGCSLAEPEFVAGVAHERVMCACRRRGVCGVSHGCRVEQKKGIASCELSLLHFAIWSAVRIPVVVRQSNYCSKIDANCVSYLSQRWILTYRRIHHHLLIITIIIITGGFVHRSVIETSFDISSSSP